MHTRLRRVEHQRAQHAQHVHADYHGRAGLAVPFSEYGDVRIHDGQVLDRRRPENQGRRQGPGTGEYLPGNALDERRCFQYAPGQQCLAQRLFSNVSGAPVSMTASASTPPARASATLGDLHGPVQDRSSRSRIVVGTLQWREIHTRDRRRTGDAP